MTHLRQIMLEELRRRNFADSTIHSYLNAVEHFSRYFHRRPDQLGPERNADRKLPLTTDAMAQHQVGNIHTSNQEDQRRGAQHERQRLPKITGEFLMERHQPYSVPWILPMRPHLDVVFMF